MSNHDDPMERLRKADPVDASDLIAAWSDNDAKASLLKEITAMSTKTIPRESDVIAPVIPLGNSGLSRRRRPLIMATAAAAAALVIGVGLTLAGTPDPAYAIFESADGTIQVNILANFRDGDALARDLRDRGIDAQVETVPASPSMVGTVELGTTDGPAAGIQTAGPDGSNEVFDWAIDPAVFTGMLTVTVFVEAEDGETFGAAQEIFEPGEKLDGLHCALGEPMRASDVARYLSGAGLTAQWSIITPTSDPSVTNSTRVDEVPSGTVLSGYAVDNSNVRFDVLPDGQTLDFDHAGYVSDFPCTPEAAAKWS